MKVNEDLWSDGWMEGGGREGVVVYSLAVTADDMVDRSMYMRYEGRVGLFLKGKGVSWSRILISVLETHERDSRYK